MPAMSACMRRLGASAGALVLAMLAGPAASPAAAGDGPVADPKLWCGNAAKMIGDKDTEKFMDSFVFASNRLIERANVAQAFAALAPALAREGEFIASDFLAEKTYGESFSRVWFLIQFDNGLLFLRCEGAKRGKGWIIYSVTYDSAANNVNLP
jgi:hypothetical protein